MLEPVTLLNVSAAAFGIWWAWYRGLRPHLSNRFQSRLQNICNEINQLEADSDVPTGNADFDVLREFAEGMLKNSERVTVLDLLISGFVTGFDPSVDAEERTARIEKLISGDRGEELKALTKKLIGETGIYLVARSPSLWIPATLLLLYQVLRAIGGLSVAVFKIAVVKVGLILVRSITRRPRVGGTFFRMRGHL